MGLISPEEKAYRVQIIKETNFSVDMEGFVISPELKKLFERYIAGEIELPEVIKTTTKRLEEKS